MSNNDLKYISDMTNKITEAKTKFTQDILEYLNIQDLPDGLNIHDLLKNINKNDPRIIELNEKLKEFTQFLNKATNELANLSLSINNVLTTTMNYQQCTCNHKFTER